MTTCHFHVFLGHPSAAASNGHTLVHGNIYSQCVLLLCSRHAETIIANNDGVDAASTAAVTDQCQSEKHQLVVAATSKPPEKQSGSVVAARWEH